MVVGCVDPRVDPGHVLGLANGEAAIIRNVGGRITPATLRTMAMLSKVGQANADTRVPGTWNLVILHHTDCGMTDLAAFPDLLAEYFETTVDGLEAKAVSDPIGSVRADVDVIMQTLHAPDFLVSGLVYDVDTGRVDVAPPRRHCGWTELTSVTSPGLYSLLECTIARDTAFGTWVCCRSARQR